MVLSGRASELDRVRGFDRGADDYVCKPFSYPELRGRVAALLRRADRRPGARLPARRRARGRPARRARSACAATRVALSQKEFALLRTLVAEPTRVFTKEELLRSIWGYRAIGSTRTLDSHACRLRQQARRPRRPLRRQRVGRRLPARRRPSRAARSSDERISA